MAARTAVVAGTATAVSGGVQQRQQRRATEAEQAQAYREEEPAAPPPAPAAEADVVSQLERLAAMQQQGILTEAEFAAQKAKILNA